jgi:hypothetical protein
MKIETAACSRLSELQCTAAAVMLTAAMFTWPRSACRAAAAAASWTPPAWGNRRGVRTLERVSRTLSGTVSGPSSHLEAEDTPLRLSCVQVYCWLGSHRACIELLQPCINGFCSWMTTLFSADRSNHALSASADAERSHQIACISY